MTRPRIIASTLFLESFIVLADTTAGAHTGATGAHTGATAGAGPAAGAEFGVTVDTGL